MGFMITYVKGIPKSLLHFILYALWIDLNVPKILHISIKIVTLLPIVESALLWNRFQKIHSRKWYKYFHKSSLYHRLALHRKIVIGDKFELNQEKKKALHSLGCINEAMTRAMELVEIRNSNVIGYLHLFFMPNNEQRCKHVIKHIFTIVKFMTKLNENGSRWFNISVLSLSKSVTKNHG